ncbi:MAG: acyl-CoA dehydrogenase C-terminal domain-containing protein [Proteobacteria bacterium]|nr:acyl-CoA dehydrogenase C-terminal domain-containing protein [Pseudomonadota bacterium]
MMFLVNDWIGMHKLTALPGNEDIDAEVLEAILEEAGKFCSTELLTINRQGDEVGATFENGSITTPPGFKEAYKKFIDNGWTSIDADPEHGGQGLPKLFQNLIDEMLSGCNLSFKLYSELSHGVYHLLATTASKEIRDRYLPKLVAGTWSGSMCLTEPHCGTDLGLLTTKAAANKDGSYSISGSKIFITSGDNDLTENILHLVLARLEDAPEGSRGISLFLVPRFLVNDDGSLGERNPVYTASIEHKMGIRASATCALNFENATGYMIGEPNYGLATMFKMMNIERLTIGVQGLGFADIAYQNAVHYARERLQSRAPAPRPDDSKAADPIIYQPEIKRQLLSIRSQIEGTRALIVYAGFHVDVMEKSTDAVTQADAADTVALLTPVLKAFATDLGMECTLSAQQVFGGHGYVSEHGMEQLVRDCRITQIYEGTNEVQAGDLVFRKLSGRTGEFAGRFFANWRQMLNDNSAHDDMNAYVAPTLEALEKLVDATAWTQERMQSDPGMASGAATNYLRLFALSIIACIWTDIIASLRDKQGDFFDAKRDTALFYMQHVLPETAALHAVITNGSESLAEFDVNAF